MAIDRTISLRLVETRRLAGSGPLHPVDRVQQAVARANEIYADTGIEFRIRSIESHHMPHLYKYVRDKDAEGCSHGRNFCWTWADVRDELRQVFPNAPVDAYPDDDHKSAGYWLIAMATFYSDPAEILVWLVEESAERSGAAGPRTGRMVFVNQPDIWSTEFDIPTTTLGHEIGHFLGLKHVIDSSLHPGYTHCDRWDEIFIPGTPNVFFSSREDARCDDPDVRYIMKVANDNSQISVLGAYGPIQITLNGTVYQASGSGVDEELKGIFRATGSVHAPPNSWGFAMNAMPGEFPVDPLDGHIPRFFSDSQLATMEDFLTNDVEFDAKYKNLWLTAAGDIPVGAIPGSLTSLRSRLGARTFKVNSYQLVVHDKQRPYDFQGQGVRYPDAQIMIWTDDGRLFRLFFLPDDEALVQHYEPQPMRANVFLFSRQYQQCVDALRNDAPLYVWWDAVAGDFYLSSNQELPGEGES